jgi:hypothetical protein
VQQLKDEQTGIAKVGHNQIFSFAVQQEKLHMLAL